MRKLLTIVYGDGKEETCEVLCVNFSPLDQITYTDMNGKAYIVPKGYKSAFVEVK